MTTGKKKSKFITQDSVPDDHYLDTFGGGVNRKIPKPKFFKQIRDEAQTFIYPTVEKLQQANLEADPDNPIYVRVAENEFRLYTITSLAPGPNDIELDNGTTATFQKERIPSADEIPADGDDGNVQSGLDRRVISLSDITALASLTEGTLLDRQQFSVGSYLPDTSTGSALLRWRPDLPKSRHDGVLFFSLTVPMFTGTDTTDYRNGVGETDPGGDGVMELVRGEIIYDATVLIPSHYSSLQESINDVDGRVSSRPGVAIRHVMESGFQPVEGVSLSGRNYARHIIQSVDAEVVVDPSLTGVFITITKGVPPVLDTLVNLNGVGGFAAFWVSEGSTGAINAGAGIKNGAGRGLYISGGSSFDATSSVFTGFQQAGLHVSQTAMCQCHSIDLSGNSQDPGNTFGAMYASRTSLVHGPDAVVTDSGGDAVRAQRGAQIIVPGVDVSNTSGVAFVANNCARIVSGSDAPTGTGLMGPAVAVNNSALVSILGAQLTIDSSVTDAAVDIENGDVNIKGANITGYSGIGVFARGKCSINADQLTMDGGERHFWLEEGAEANASNSQMTNATINGVRILRGSKIVLDSSEVSGSAGDDLYIESGSQIIATGTTTTNGAGSPDIGDTNVSSFNAIDGSNGIIWA